MTNKCRSIPAHICSELDEAIRRRYPDLRKFFRYIEAVKGGYSAEVKFQNESRGEDGSTIVHGTLNALFKYRGQWHMIRDWND